MIMMVKIRDLTWKQLNDFLKNTVNVTGHEYKTCKIITSYTRYNKIEWARTYKEAHQYIRPEMLDLKINTATWGLTPTPINSMEELIEVLKKATKDQEKIDAVVQFAKDAPKQSMWGMMLQAGMTEDNLRGLLAIDVANDKFNVVEEKK